MFKKTLFLVAAAILMTSLAIPVFAVDVSQASTDWWAMGQNIAAVIAAVIAAAITARKLVGGPIAAKILQQQLEKNAVYRYPIVLVAQKAAEAIGLRATLVERGFRDVRVADAEDFERKGKELVVCVLLGEKDDRGNLLNNWQIEFAGRHALVEGLLYIKGRAQSPSGDWSFANSSITLHARLRELVEWVRSAQ